MQEKYTPNYNPVACSGLWEKDTQRPKKQKPRCHFPDFVFSPPSPKISQRNQASLP